MNEKETFYSYEALKELLTITIEDGEILDVKGVGSIYLELTKEHNNQLIELKNVLHVSRISHNLLSIYKIVKAGSTITFIKKRYEVRKEKALIIVLNREGIWIIKERVAEPSEKRTTGFSKELPIKKNQNN